MTRAWWGAQGSQLCGKTDIEQASSVTARHRSPRPGEGRGRGENTTLNEAKTASKGAGEQKHVHLFTAESHRSGPRGQHTQGGGGAVGRHEVSQRLDTVQPWA